MKIVVLTGIVLAMFAGAANAHGKKEHGEKQAFVAANLDMVRNEFGHTGDSSEVTRTINVAMSDEMKFEPAAIHVKAGETIRFVINNPGEILHELVIGKTESLLKHAAMMQKFPGMEHSEPYMAHADVGQTAEIIWTFSEPGTFEYGCLIPGHYEAGMKGLIYVDGGNIIPVADTIAPHEHDHQHNASRDNVGLNRN